MLPTVNNKFPPPPTAPIPVKPHFPLRTAHKKRPSLEIITDFNSPRGARMGFHTPRLGALGLTFSVMRALQFAGLIAAIGLCANFIDEFSTKSLESPSELLGALVVAVVAVIYVVISYILYYDVMLPYLLSGILDGLLLIAFIVVVSILGKPLSELQCALMPKDPDANNFWTSVPFHIKSQETHDDGLYFTFVHIDQPTCYETKAIWGLSIALCVLFAFSSIVCVGLWRRVSGRTGGRAGAGWGIREKNYYLYKSESESDVSLYGHNTMTTAPPQFPLPPLAPMPITRGARRSDNQQYDNSDPQDVPVPTIRARAGLPQNRRSLSGSRSSIDSDASSSTLSRGASPERHLRISGGGLAPPPPVRHCCNGGRVGLGIMPTIPGSPIDAKQERTMIDGISPIMSRAPEALPLPVADPAFRSTSTSNLTLAVPSAARPHPNYPLHVHGQVGAGRATLHPPLTITTEFPIISPSAYSPTDNITPQEYKRAAPPQPQRSPLSPLSLRGLGSFMARRGCKRKEVPPPIIVHPSSPSQFAHVVNGHSPGMDSVALGTPVDGPSWTPSLPQQTPSPPKRRRTVWGMMVEGWWDLGLLERMGSGKRVAKK
ncbi:hypothetical protein QBC32DRAFT_212832 [Pseudoneurospora amorphoporcata]|uniref:MARVEL domain-containing protein n=1 Tax=Pseudoneurospora amorphoporcata TaxID=241081 RepID=A0AAN6SGG1_9PEZI|nr:hypothetical protein QBC32DRAFT_212832 [Pseudoneurospora amorphoporcata]